jgi:inosose dehydratase
LDATDPEVVKICLDTGHTVVGGGDPVELARSACDRIAHLHLKDVDARILERVRTRELTVEQAWEHGLFCPLGEGAVDFGAVLAELDGFGGWAVIEQDRVAVSIDDLDSVRDVEIRNLAHVRSA